MDSSQPLCLILMPYRKRKDATGRVIDFEAVYDRLVVPAVQAAGMQPVKADEGRAGGIQKSLLEPLLRCSCVIADLTTANAGLFYNLGVRHAMRPNSTVLLYALGTAQLPFDVNELGAVPYRVSPQGLPVHEAKYRTGITERLKKGAGAAVDSPIYQLLDDYPSCSEAKQRAIDEQLHYTATMRKRLAEARSTGGDAIKQVEDTIRDIAQADAALILDLFFSYRMVSWWSEMIELVPRMSPSLATTTTVQEQLGLALNWAGRGEEAEQVLRELISRRGPSSESYGALGRILKDRWEKALARGERAEAKELLDKAVIAYLRGFEADWRDTYPGANVVLLMELKQPADARRRQILPVVHYAVEQRIESGAADYWDFATLLELAVISCDEAKGIDALARTVARVRESWEPEGTARDLKLIREARTRRGAETPAWAERAEEELLKAAARGTARP